MLTPQLMESMDDGHLVAAIHAEINPLTTTPLEIELLGRVEDLLEQIDAEAADALAEFSLEAGDIKTLGEALIGDADNSAAILSAVADADIDTPSALIAQLKLADQFKSLAEDAGDVFTRLAQLTTQE